MKVERSVTIHTIAQCEDCDWMQEDYQKARAAGRRHAEQKGHRVAIETGTVGYYDGRKT
jgi:hypothetical protein